MPFAFTHLWWMKEFLVCGWVYVCGCACMCVCGKGRKANKWNVCRVLITIIAVVSLTSFIVECYFKCICRWLLIVSSMFRSFVIQFLCVVVKPIQSPQNVMNCKKISIQSALFIPFPKIIHYFFFSFDKNHLLAYICVLVSRSFL